MEFKFKITNRKNTKTGTVEADSREDAAEQIKKEGYFILELSEKKTSWLQTSYGSKNKLSEFDRINLTDHMASMIGAGAPLLETLEAYSEEDEKKSEIVARLVSDIERGKQLSLALQRFPKIFAPLYIALVKAGEVSGSLDETLGYLANELRREYEFKQRVKSALFYPVLVLIVSILVVILVVTTVIPRVTEITKSLEVQMPFFTRIIVGFSDFLTSYYIFVILAVAFLTFAAASFLRSRDVREKLKVRMLTLPVIGVIARKYILARLLRIIGSCVKYGIPLPQAFEAAEGVVDNDSYKEAVKRINKKIIKGESLAKAISGEDRILFPGIIARSIKGAEKTGTIDTTLHRLSTQYELEVERDMKRATELMEPVMVVVLGVIVLGIAVSVLAPVYQLTSSIK